MTPPTPTVVDVEPVYLDNAALIIGAFDYAAAASKIECQPSIKSATFRGMKRTAAYTSTSVESWTLAIDFAQDFETAESFSNMLFDHQGEKVTIEFAPIDGGKAWLVDVQLVPGGIGGTGSAHATTSISLGVLGQPRRKTATSGTGE